MSDTSIQFADEEYVEQYLAELPKAAWLECREKGHDFRYYKGEESDQSTQTRQVVIRTEKCRRCTTKRHDVIEVANRRATILNTKYEWPEGYLLEKGHGRLGSDGRDMIRHENLFANMRRQAEKAR